MRNARVVAIVLILVGLLAVSARARVIPGRWEKIAALAVGTPIAVALKNRDRIERKFEGFSPSELSLRTGSAQAAIPRSDIRRITTRESDSLANGTLIGAGVGTAIMVWMVTNLQPDLETSWAVWLMASGVGGGALIGAGIDALKKTEVVLYQAP